MEKKQSELPVRVVVLDVLKPHKPNILEFGKLICKGSSIENVNLSVYAVDEKTESVKIVIEGEDIDFQKIKEMIEHNGGVIHSMDRVILGKSKKLIDIQ